MVLAVDAVRDAVSAPVRCTIGPRGFESACDRPKSSLGLSRPPGSGPERDAQEDPFMAKIGIIGGSGLDDPEILKDAHDDVVVDALGRTEFAAAPRRRSRASSACCSRATAASTRCRPPRSRTAPTSRRCVDAGCTHILATTAVGSLRKKIGRGDLVIVDQFIDFTRFRKTSFHDDFEPGAGRCTRRWPTRSTRSCASC